MIYQIESPLLVPKIIELATRTMKEPFQKDKLEDILIDGISLKDTRIYVDERKGEVVGYIFASVELIEGDNALFVQSCSVDPFIAKEAPADHSIFDELFARVLAWGKDIGVEYIYMGTRRPRPFKRRAQFEYHTTMMRRRVGHEFPISKAKTTTAKS